MRKSIFCFVLLTANFASGPLFAQAVEGGSTPDPQHAPFRGQPYSIVKTTTSIGVLADGTTTPPHVEKEACFRDSAGRVRCEVSHQVNGLWQIYSVSIRDVENLALIRLNPAKKEAVVTHLHGIAPPAEAGSQLADIRAMEEQEKSYADTPTTVTMKHGTSRSEPLQHRTILGLDADGRRITVTSESSSQYFPKMIDSWRSPALDLLLEQTEITPAWKVTMVSSDLRRDEPDPALFTIPTDYTVTERKRGGESSQASK